MRLFRMETNEQIKEKLKSISKQLNQLKYEESLLELVKDTDIKAKATFINDKEKEVCKILSQIKKDSQADWLYHPQTPFSSFMNTAPDNKELFFKYGYWYVDFLIAKLNDSPYAIIEYFGGGHYKDSKTAIRDSIKALMLRKAGIPLLIINDKENQLTSSNKEVEKAIQCFLGQPSLNFSECNIDDIVIVTNPQ